ADQGRLAEAEAALRKAIDLQPDYAQAHYNLGLALRNQGKLAEAEAAFRKAIELQPDFAEAYVGLGLALKNQGKLAEAVKAYRRAVELKPNDTKAHYDLLLKFLHGALPALRVRLMLSGGRCLHVAPQLDRSPALLGDAAHELAHEGMLGLEQGEPVIGLDGEQCGKFLEPRERRRQLLAGRDRREILLCDLSELRLELRHRAGEPRGAIAQQPHRLVRR